MADSAIPSGAGTAPSATDPWSGPYLAPLDERTIQPVPGGWWLPLTLAALGFGIWAYSRWRTTRKQGMEAARLLAGHLRRLGEPLTNSERRLLKTSLEKVDAPERERLLNQPGEMNAHLERSQLGDGVMRGAIGRKLTTRVPERTEGLLVGTRLRLAVEGFPGRFDVMVREAGEETLTLDIIDSSLRRMPFLPGDLVTGHFGGGNASERSFVSRIVSCGMEGRVPVCRLHHGDIVTTRRRDGGKLR